jgi:hypothetical protein
MKRYSPRQLCTTTNINGGGAVFGGMAAVMAAMGVSDLYM